MKKIIIAIDSFKGSLTSVESGRIVEDELKHILPDAEIIVLPVADGGEGTADILTNIYGGRREEVIVRNPLSRPIVGWYGISGQRAIIDLSTASGLNLLKECERNPLITSTCGTGDLIRAAVRKECREIILGVGGSATNDCGVGMLQALGYRFRDSSGNEVGEGGVEVGRIVDIYTSGRLPELDECRFRVACDVKNPLYGPEGASIVYGKQKGGDKKSIELLDRNLEKFGRMVDNLTGEHYSEIEGAGAGGGTGFAVAAFLGGTIESGIDLLLESLNFDEMIKGADLIITGEGRLDMQTTMGKAPYGILRRGLKAGIPVIGIGGCVAKDAVSRLSGCGFRGIYGCVDADSVDETELKPEKAEANLRACIRLNSDKIIAI